MTGAEHYAEAERLLAVAGDAGEHADTYHARAQVHAALALAAATYWQRPDEWPTAGYGVES